MRMFLNRSELAVAMRARATETNYFTYRLFFPLLLLVALLAPLIRIDDIGAYVNESLYTEDLTVFIPQSHELGIRSLWEPYAGYLFLYNRIIALLARSLPLAAIPYAFFAASLMSFTFIAATLKNRAKDAGLNELQIVFLVCMIALQPNYGEAFFNLNMSGYFLGIALALHVCIPRRDVTPVSTILFLILTSLTGPFSVFLIPILALQWSILRDFSSRKWTYVIVILCGLIQAIFLMQRATQIPMDTSAADWLRAISSFIFFGGSNKLTYVAAIVFWAILLASFFRWTTTQRHSRDRVAWLSPSFSALTALLLYFAGAVAAQSIAAQNLLSILSPIDFNSRYFLIPYSLVFFVALACTQGNKATQTTMVSLICIICGAGILSVDRDERASRNEFLSHFNLQWTAFVKFREIKPDLLIPVNPPMPIYPPIGRALKMIGNADSAPQTPPNPILLDPQQLGASPPATGAGPTIYFDISDYCVTSNYLALEIDIWRSRMGWAIVRWGRPGHFDSDRSLERFYPDGASVMQFAFRRDLSDYLIRFDPSDGAEPTQIINNIREPAARLGFIVAEATQPGGDVKIEAVRLFCLN